MSLRGELASNLKRAVDVLAEFDGVIGVFVFGSHARGDYDEYSDIDLLVVFEDKASMWRCWRDMFRVVGTLGMDLHVIPETLEELKMANTVFLEELVKFGRVLYAKYPIEVFLSPVKLKHYALIFYDMAGLSVRDKMRVSYLLYRKRGKGLVDEAGGVKLNDGCILVPYDVAENVFNALNNLEVKARKIEIFLGGDALQKLQMPKRAPHMESS